MLDRGELGERGGADPLGGRVGRGQLRILGLEGAELLHEPVVLGVRNLGLVEHIVAIVVVVDLGPQLVDARPRRRQPRRFHLLLHPRSPAGAGQVFRALW